MTADENIARLRAIWSGPPGSHRPRRPADDVWDALAEVCGWEVSPADKAARGRLGRVVEALRKMDATAADVKEHASQYRRIMPNVLLTPEALLKHWAATAPPVRRKTVIENLNAGTPEMDYGRPPDLAEMARAAQERLMGAMDTRADGMKETT